MVKRVVIGKQAQKQLRRAPERIRGLLGAWKARVEDVGLEEVRKVPGYHDKPLAGDRGGQRSIRLGIHWRAFYVLSADGAVECAEVIEVNNHEY